MKGHKKTTKRPSRSLMAPATGGLAVLWLVSLIAFPAAGQSLNHDTDQPIEITADSLEVLQEQELATFAGNVDAVQGELVLSANQLRVHYLGDRNEQSDVGLTTGASSKIQRIEAEGNVLLSSPEETAKGDIGIYDVLAKMVTLEGAVVLTRGDNVIRGNRLEMDLENGTSRMIGNDITIPIDTNQPSTRVRALFTPNDANDRSATGGKSEPQRQAPLPTSRPSEPSAQ